MKHLLRCPSGSRDVHLSLVVSGLLGRQKRGVEVRARRNHQEFLHVPVSEGHKIK